MFAKIKKLVVPRLSLRSRDRESREFDPFQVFQVAPEPCHVLTVTVARGRKITKGWTADLLDTPDPYVILRMRFTPNPAKRTRFINNDPNPVWNETFQMYIDPKENNILDVELMDANYTIDQSLGTQEYDLAGLGLDQSIEIKLIFNNGSEIILELQKTILKDADLRYSLALCESEKQFLSKRKEKVFEAMKRLLGSEKGPQALREVPTIGVLGSGGGFRAMCCLSGVFKMMADTRILDCVTYVAGLSGSAWYVSTLYSHPDFPQKSPGELQGELRDSVSKSPFRLLGPHCLTRYLGSIVGKNLSGQPVSFTDFFGHLLGDTLLRDRMSVKLSDQRVKIDDGQMPLPLYTCLHVKKNVMAKVFQEWLEFSPYEVGLSKYGAYMKSEHFGSKLYMGMVIKKYEEFPLHYLQGVWGSAFCILFKQLVHENGRRDLAEIMRDNEANRSERAISEQLSDFKVDGKDTETSEDESDNIVHPDKTGQNENGDETDSEDIALDPKAELKKKKKEEHTSYWRSMVSGIFSSSYLNTLTGRAAMIFNPLRGLSLNYLYPISPFSPTTPSDDVEFKGAHEALPTDKKRLYLVDGGLTFNSPYPLLLRPQRSVDIFLSFDFSARPTDSTPPFKELLLAEKWARVNKVAFPPVEMIARRYSQEETVREYYVFQHPTDPYCPTILHFVIVNNKFRHQKAPGVERSGDEELDFSNFSLFDDPEKVYSLFNFSYTNVQFNRISKLMEFNALEGLDAIKEAIADCVVRKRRLHPRPPIRLGDIARLKLRFRNKEAASQLKDYIEAFPATAPPTPSAEGPHSNGS